MNNNKDHLVGQLTTAPLALSQSGFDVRSANKMDLVGDCAELNFHQNRNKLYNFRNMDCQAGSSLPCPESVNV